MSLISTIFMTIYHLTFKCDLDLQATIFFTKNPNLKKLWGWGQGEGGGVRGDGGGVDGWTDTQAQTNLPLQLQQDNNCAKLF